MENYGNEEYIKQKYAEFLEYYLKAADVIEAIYEGTLDGDALEESENNTKH